MIVMQNGVILKNCDALRFAEVESVANIAVFFASDLTSFVKGKCLRANGGAQTDPYKKLYIISHPFFLYLLVHVSRFAAKDPAF